MVKLAFCGLSIVLLAAMVPGAAAAPAMKEGWAVIVVDVQPCFVEGGSLAVSGADDAYVAKAQRDTKWLYRRGTSSSAPGIIIHPIISRSPAITRDTTPSK